MKKGTELTAVEAVPLSDEDGTLGKEGAAADKAADKEELPEELAPFSEFGRFIEKGDYKYFFNFCGHAKGCYQQPACQVLGPQPEAGTVQN